MVHNDAVITICMPVYNRAELVTRSLDSIAAQNHRPLDVILVDNNSTDSTFEALRAWKESVEDATLRIEVLREVTPGACAARNLSLRHVATPWTLFFDSDDTMPPDHIEKVVEAILANPQADVVGWGRVIHFADGKTALKKFMVKNPRYNNLTQSIFATQSFAARTEIFRDAGGWDNSVAVGQDIELGSRILNLTDCLVAIDNHHVDVFMTESSITNTTGMASMKRTLDKIRSTLPETQSHWVDLQTIVKAATWGRNDADSPEMVREILARTPLPRRLLWRAFHRYLLAGGRGVAKIYAAMHFNRMS